LVFFNVCDLLSRVQRLTIFYRKNRLLLFTVLLVGTLFFQINSKVYAQEAPLPGKLQGLLKAWTQSLSNTSYTMAKSKLTTNWVDGTLNAVYHREIGAFYQNTTGIVTKMRRSVMSQLVDEIVPLIVSEKMSALATNAEELEKYAKSFGTNPPPKAKFLALLQKHLETALKNELAKSLRKNPIWNELFDELLATKLVPFFTTIRDYSAQLTEHYRDLVVQVDEEFTAMGHTPNIMQRARKITAKVEKANQWTSKILRINISGLRGILRVLVKLGAIVFVLKAGNCVDAKSDEFGHLAPCILTQFLDGYVSSAY